MHATYLQGNAVCAPIILEAHLTSLDKAKKRVKGVDEDGFSDWLTDLEF